MGKIIKLNESDLIGIVNRVINENKDMSYSERMQNKFETSSKYSYSDILRVVRYIKDEYGLGVLKNPHILRNQLEKELEGVGQYLWDISVGTIRDSLNHGRFVELFINERHIGNIFL